MKLHLTTCTNLRPLWFKGERLKLISGKLNVLYDKSRAVMLPNDVLENVATYLQVIEPAFIEFDGDIYRDDDILRSEPLFYATDEHSSLYYKGGPIIDILRMPSIDMPLFPITEAAGMLAAYPIPSFLFTIVPPGPDMIIERARIDYFIKDQDTETAELDLQILRPGGFNRLAFKKGALGRRALDMFFPEGIRELTVFAISEKSIAGSVLVFKYTANFLKRNIMTS